jgi:glycogen operon protein
MCSSSSWTRSLASTLARELYDVDRLSAFFDVVHQDPTLQAVKLISEPWDLGSGGVFLNGDALHELDDDGTRVRDASFLLLFNAHYEPLDFRLPSASFGETWTVVVDTATEVGERNATFTAGSTTRAEARSVIVLTRP